MSLKTLSDVISPLKHYGAALEKTVKEFHHKIYEEWKTRNTDNNIVIVGLDRMSNLEVLVPMLKLKLSSKTRLVFIDKDLYSETEFYSHNDDKDISIIKMYMNTTDYLTFNHPSEEGYDTDYAQNLEWSVLSKVLIAASEKGLISL
ncbi:hypothetical protein [Kosakonia oryzae]|uniref:Uncharacterized protein n=1 Tax=Kosakonia oryzae TaxID=497725 RepID=A0AA94H2N6_9ENTR|nr:hypothetical protein [Kosakonia oryzae]ANI83304.1 hypothetical protein AWR26_14480 [Kosakonia oryzae]SFC03130.1 hypothetical protein SAMN05216286_1359 [Kosakonia oryzae]